ncbi:MAG: hypothetical protein M1826_004392, partial [Phylliscum demangeonii]
MSDPANTEHDHDSNPGNQYASFPAQPQYFGDFSSMSTLASAAHAQGQQPPSHEVNGHHGGGAFPDLDAHLALYGNLNAHHPNPEYHAYGTSPALNGGSIVPTYSRSHQPFNDWYGQPIGQGLHGFLDSYQNLSEPPPAHAGDLMRNGHPSPSAAALSHLHAVDPAAATDHLTPAPVPAPGPAPSLTPTPTPTHASAPGPAPSRDVGPESVPLAESQTVRQTPQSTTSRASLARSTSSMGAPGTALPAHGRGPGHARTIPDRSATKARDDFRPKISIPTQLAPEEYARQCIYAAVSSRLSPFALHPDEYQLLRDHLNHLQVTGYLNIRNGILRLWMKNPLVNVTREEAAGCTKDYRWFDVAEVAYQWLIRNGYINFGCTEVPGAADLPARSTAAHGSARKTIVVIGAGMAGLGCARQLEALFTQHRPPPNEKGEAMPRIIVLEGRTRVGGRVYSQPLKTPAGEPRAAGVRGTADLGAQIITGFEHGNPLNAIIRGQLALQYRALKDTLTLYDVDGAAVDKPRDQLVERLYNDILERVSSFRNPKAAPPTVEGDRELIELGRDPTGEGGKIISVVEGAAASIPATGAAGASSRSADDHPPLSAAVDKVTGKASVGAGRMPRLPAAESLRRSGWPLHAHVAAHATLDLDSQVRVMSHPTLGGVMDDAVMQYQSLVELTPQDLRLLNWHFANLEYANAANVKDLSLGGWDQDLENEFDGAHAGIVGGYMQVPQAIWQHPTRLDVRTQRIVRHVGYSPDGSAAARVECENGEVFEADAVVVTVPLGVLKAGSVLFDPPLPARKLGPIERLGFGTLNKVVLVFDQAFWHAEGDMFGLLRDSAPVQSLQQSDYVAGRGRFYLFWNCLRTAGRPTLVALMAGDAAHQTETSSDHELVTEARHELGKIFGSAHVPEPSEVIVSRWGRDRFARGSYSYVGPQAHADDYDRMAERIGNLHFAGEATCGTHPATVHGAYLSGLRAASEVAERVLGPIAVPRPLIPPKAQFELGPAVAGRKRKADESARQRLRSLKEGRLAAYEAEVNEAVLAQLGGRPTKPEKSGANPFLLYQKDHWHICKQKCDDARKQATKNAEAKATRNEVRAALGQMWREAPDAEKKPYLDQTASNKQSNSASAADFKEKVEQWDRAADAHRAEYRDAHPSRPSAEEEGLQAEVELETRASTSRGSKRAVAAAAAAVAA